MRIIEELYFGNIDPNMKQLDCNSAYEKAMKTFVENEEQLTELLEGKEKQLFYGLLNAHAEISGVTGVERFIDGFKLGSRFMLEVMDEENSCFKDIV